MVKGLTKGEWRGRGGGGWGGEKKTLVSRGKNQNNIKPEGHLRGGGGGRRKGGWIRDVVVGRGRCWSRGALWIPIKKKKKKKKKTGGGGQFGGKKRAQKAAHREKFGPFSGFSVHGCCNRIVANRQNTGAGVNIAKKNPLKKRARALYYSKKFHISG